MTYRTTDTARRTKLATLALEHFETFTRSDSNEHFYKLTDTRPEWLYDLVQSAHDGMFPDDFKYEFIHDALSIIAEDDYDEDRVSESIDSDVDVYTHRLLSWISSNLGRMSYVDDAVSEYGWPEQGLSQALMQGQYREREEVYNAVCSALDDVDDEPEDSDEGEDE